MTAKVYLVGAGPGDPELLTLKALKALRAADVVLHDELVGPDILGLIPSTAKIQNVGKRAGQASITQDEINSLLVAQAMLGLTVVRLKGGDPLVFGRGGEEIEALRRAHIECEVIPGITAALGAAAAAQIPLTHRRYASELIFAAGHHAIATLAADHLPLTSPGATLVLYMPGSDYQAIASKLRVSGFNGKTPCAIISQATTATQQVYLTTVRELTDAPLLAPPALLIVGPVAKFALQTLAHERSESEPMNCCWNQL